MIGHRSFFFVPLTDARDFLCSFVSLPCSDATRKEDGTQVLIRMINQTVVEGDDKG